MTARIPPKGAPWRNFHGRIKGKALRPNQEAWLDEDLGRLSPGPVGWDVNPDRHPIELKEYFGDREIWLEIGFGGGEHMVHQAVQTPDVGIIGCEPYINGVAMLLGKIRTANARNIAVYPGDVRNMFDVLPEASIARAFLLYPDPWPKKRHHKRRLVQPSLAALVADRLEPGGLLWAATDWAEYAEWIVEVLDAEPQLERERAPRVDDPDSLDEAGRPRTRFEARGLRLGHRVWDLRYRRKR